MIESSYDPVRACMRHTARGTVSAEDILKATAAWFTHPSFDASAPVLWDFRDSYLDLSIEDLLQMYEQVRLTVTGKRRGGRTAWVHESGFVRSVIEMLYGEAEWGSRWRAFQSMDEALAWCAETDTC